MPSEEIDWARIGDVHPVLLELRNNRFSYSQGHLKNLVVRLFGAFEYMADFPVDEVPYNLSGFKAQKAWSEYWNASSPEAVKIVVREWLVVLEIVRLGGAE
jgi:hypothetical protein